MLKFNAGGHSGIVATEVKLQHRNWLASLYHISHIARILEATAANSHLGYAIKARKAITLSVLFTILCLRIFDPGPAISGASKSNCFEFAAKLVVNDNIYIGGSAGRDQIYHQFLMTYDLNGNYIDNNLFDYGFLLDDHDLLYVNGLVFTFAPTGSNVIIVKSSPSGEIQWTSEYLYESSYFHVRDAYALSINDEYYVVVTMSDSVSGEHKSRIVKLNSSGSIQYDIKLNEVVSFTDSDDHIYVLDFVSGAMDRFYRITKIDANLNQIWERQIDDGDIEYYKFVGSDNILISDGAENLYCVLTYNNNAKFQILKINSDNGAIKWGIEEDHALGIIHYGQLFIDQNGDIVVMFARDNILYKFNSLGEKQWGEKIYPDDWGIVVDQYLYSLEAETLLIDETNNYYIIGYDIRGLGGNIYIIKTNQHGEIEWSEIIDDEIFNLVFTGADFDYEGNIIIGGSLIMGGEGTDAVIYKYDQNGVREFRVVHDIDEECDPFHKDETDDDNKDDSDTCGCGC